MTIGLRDSQALRPNRACTGKWRIQRPKTGEDKNIITTHTFVEEVTLSETFIVGIGFEWHPDPTLKQITFLLRNLPKIRSSGEDGSCRCFRK